MLGLLKLKGRFGWSWHEQECPVVSEHTNLQSDDRGYLTEQQQQCKGGHRKALPILEGLST
eukprot:scaffold19594_cov30-Cyclotella_meneghiniana.AAC.1